MCHVKGNGAAWRRCRHVDELFRFELRNEQKDRYAKGNFCVLGDRSVWNVGIIEHHDFFRTNISFLRSRCIVLFRTVLWNSVSKKIQRNDHQVY